ncbi:DJ-1/PfpI family protein [Enterovibrio norvegicus]|uniref:Protease n=1 Tax=Enterovibrio norvegicus TaxID=188144 RepID=A0A2N7LH65_9GAMM|nr:DJ-1/PfpI family protein [Enterovibrio norvegicus]PMN94825.1 protease [Enterovibrio norvegicus]
MAKILMITGDFVEDYENMVPYQALIAMGHEVHAVCPEKRAGDFIATSIHDFEGDQTYTEKRGHNFQLNADFNTVKADQFDGLYLPGGRSPEYLRLDQRVTALIRAFFADSKPVASICHGIQLLTASHVVEGRKLTAYPACKPEVEMAGGTYVEIPLDQAITDGQLVTAPAWPAHPAMLSQFTRLL